MLTRRDFLANVVAAGAAVSAALAIPTPIIAATAPSRAAVVSIHLDQPYLDRTGTAIPYHPPHGMRSAAGVEHLSEEAFRRLQCYV